MRVQHALGIFLVREANTLAAREANADAPWSLDPNADPGKGGIQLLAGKFQTLSRDASDVLGIYADGWSHPF